MEDPFLYGITLGLINAKCPFNWRKHTRIENCSDESSETFYDYDSRQVVICKEQWEAKLDCKFSLSHVTHKSEFTNRVKNVLKTEFEIFSKQQAEH